MQINNNKTSYLILDSVRRGRVLNSTTSRNQEKYVPINASLSYSSLRPFFRHRIPASVPNYLDYVESGNCATTTTTPPILDLLELGPSLVRTACLFPVSDASNYMDIVKASGCATGATNPSSISSVLDPFSRCFYGDEEMI